MSQKQMYGPCPCGSGKKYKFCCYLKRSEQSDARLLAEFWSNEDSEDSYLDHLLNLDGGAIQESIELCEKGLRLMSTGNYEKAIPVLRKAVSISDEAYPSANNLAVCLFVTGNLDEAYRVQRESLEASSYENPFGLSSLSAFEYIKGNEDEAKRCLDMAVGMDPLCADACVKVCESLARFKRHQDILDYVDEMGFSDSPSVCYFTGVAAANLGEKKCAKRDLKKVDSGHLKAETARRYLKHLQDGSSPSTVYGDWPYLAMYEVCPLKIIAAENERAGEVWPNHRIVADICEVFLNDELDGDDDDDDYANVIAVLSETNHPEVIRLLWAIVKGDFGPDSLRMHALRGLQERGEVDLKDRVVVLQRGEYQEVSCVFTDLN